MEDESVDHEIHTYCLNGEGIQVKFSRENENDSPMLVLKRIDYTEYKQFRILASFV